MKKYNIWSDDIWSDDIEIVWHDGTSPYSLKQNNNEYPVPVWAKILSVVGVVLLGYFMVISLMN